MRKALGVLILVAGVAGLGFWGAKSNAVAIETKITAAAEAVVKGTVHPMQVRVSGRDIALSGTADTQAELDEIAAKLDAVRGRRIVNIDKVAILPDIAPYETALAKGEDGATVATGYAPSQAARDGLAEMIPALASLPLGHGAPANWAAVMEAGKAALAPLGSGSFAISGDTVTLQGTAATPVEDQTARGALAGLDGFDTVVSIDVLDPGKVDLSVTYDAAAGFTAEGIVPRALGVDGIATALAAGSLTGDVATTYADSPGLSDALTALSARLADVETLAIRADNSGLKVEATALPGLDTDTVFAELAAALGGAGGLTVTAAPAPKNGAERVNAATGATEFAFGGVWMTRPDIPATKPACTKAAMTATAAAPILFVTGSAELDPASLKTVNAVAGIIHLCTEAPGMRVVIGGHTDAQGDDTANYVLSVARAKAVRDALIARGVAAEKMTAVGYGETEPIADNETAEGRAQNRRTTFAWPE